MGDRRQQWLRGVLDVCVLATLAGEELHGYAIASHLDQAGIGRVKGGTLYPVLARLQAAGQVASRWEPGNGGPSRKYYTLTDRGRAFLAEEARDWLAFVGATRTLIERVDTEDRQNR